VEERKVVLDEVIQALRLPLSTPLRVESRRTTAIIIVLWENEAHSRHQLQNLYLHRYLLAPRTGVLAKGSLGGHETQSTVSTYAPHW
jgi:hypothetical protein